MKYLVTSSLLDSYDWLKNCPKSWKEKALEDFTSMIRRKKRPVSEACQRGIDFERMICDNFGKSESEFEEIARLRYYPYAEGKELKKAVSIACEIFKSCRNGEQQVPLMKDIEICDKEYHLFGYADIILLNKVIDIKTTGNYRGAESYEKRSQHYLYTLCSGIKDFEYLVADFGKGKYPVDMHRIEVSLDDFECIYLLEKRIKSLMRFLEQSDLWEDYINIFTKQHNDNRLKEVKK